MISRSDGGSDWGEWRNNNGEFRKWLHTWAQGKHRYGIWAPLPWVCKEAPSGEFITAMYHMGVLKRWPGEWRRWRPINTYCDVYGILLPRHLEAALTQHLVSIRRQCPSDTEFEARLRRYILFKQETIDANTRSG